MKVMLLGAKGQLGQEIVRHPRANDYLLYAYGRDSLDIADRTNFLAIVNQVKPDLIINAAAYTAVDKAESEQEKALNVNGDSVGEIARYCSQMSIPLIHVSTDYVFDGTKEIYNEDDAPGPINVYGLSKLLGEELIRKNLINHAILRVSWVYGYYGSNFVKTILRLAKQREELTIINDQHGCPTSAREIADVIYKMLFKIKQNAFTWGTYHYCNGPQTTWYQFANEIINIAKAYDDFQVKKIVPIKTTDYPTPAKRPHNSVLNCDKLNKELQILSRSWRDILPEVIREIYQ